jgi:hypothetical protein
MTLQQPPTRANCGAPPVAACLPMPSGRATASGPPVAEPVRDPDRDASSRVHPSTRLRLHFAPARAQLERAERRLELGRGDASPTYGRSCADDDELFAKQPVARLCSRTVSQRSSYVRSLNTSALHFVLSPLRDLALLTAQRNLAFAYVMLHWSERLRVSVNVLSTLQMVCDSAEASERRIRAGGCTRSFDEAVLRQVTGEAVHWLQRPSSQALARMEAGC